MPDLTGRVLGGRYRVEAFIGRGGMSDVYRVWDEQRLVWLAMKVLHDDLADDLVFLRRFRREAKTLETLQHPHIVRFYGLDEADNLVFILMDYVDGSTLRKEIARHKVPLPMARILEILRPVCAALHYAHRLGIAHCDVKPGNIMLHQNGTVLVADFGIARLTEVVTTMTMVGAGTPAYMAPEQVRGLPPIPQTDIYGLGIVLYEMLTGGERPFTGEMASITGATSEKVRWEQVNLAPIPPSRYNPSISPEIETVVLKCLEKDPAQRIASAMELLQAFEQAVLITTGMDQAQPPQMPARQLPPKPVTKQPAASDHAAQPTLLDAPPSGSSAIPQAPPAAAPASRAAPLAQAAARRRFPGWLLSLLLGVVVISIVAGVIVFGGGGLRPTPQAPNTAQVVWVEPANTQTALPSATPAFTATPLPSSTPAGTPLPQVPPVVQAEFTSSVTPNPEAVFSPLLFTEGFDENNQPIMPAFAFTDPVRQLHAVFSYEQVNAGAQWTALWYRGSQLVYYETRPWDGGVGGLGYSFWNPGNQWIAGDYEVQIFLGLDWKASGFFTIEIIPPTITPLPSDTLAPLPSPTLNPTSTSTVVTYPTAVFTPTPTKKVVPPTATPTVPPPEKKTATPPPP